MSAAQPSKVGFFDRSILTGTVKVGREQMGEEYGFKAFRTDNDKNVTINLYSKTFPFTQLHFPPIVMTNREFLDQFITILNKEVRLNINGTEMSPGTWNADEDDMRKVSVVVQRDIPNPPSSQEMKEFSSASKGGKSRRRGQRSKKRSRKTKHRRGGADSQPATARIQMSRR